MIQIQAVIKFWGGNKKFATGKIFSSHVSYEDKSEILQMAFRSIPTNSDDIELSFRTMIETHNLTRTINATLETKMIKARTYNHTNYLIYRE